MADWKELAARAADLTNQAQAYVQNRKGRVSDAEELRLLNEWAAYLRQSHSKVAQILSQYETGQLSPSVSPQDAHKIEILSTGLDLSKRHVQSLHEYYDEEAVDLALGNVDHHLTSFFSAGPHGPGLPPPRPRRRP